jgi:hypothetical protein
LKPDLTDLKAPSSSGKRHPFEQIKKNSVVYQTIIALHNKKCKRR